MQVGFDIPITPFNSPLSRGPSRVNQCKSSKKRAVRFEVIDHNCEEFHWEVGDGDLLVHAGNEKVEERDGGGRVEALKMEE